MNVKLYELTHSHAFSFKAVTKTLKSNDRTAVECGLLALKHREATKKIENIVAVAVERRLGADPCIIQFSRTPHFAPRAIPGALRLGGLDAVYFGFGAGVSAGFVVCL